ncbi:hypothetical protein GCM10019059_07720 [Camelimonas fluminis]|uniref:Phage tail assembly protein n=1 Tax=Camelimonas fluminis TaxID=1576911 RepID=A0ABV7UEL6_9HYPH|nr:phage tail assembly protein [Camelimonas fluminis]GHE50992.1 hypothetical protein GCM10019059_07720 [Camelimonas fluminis]
MADAVVKLTKPITTHKGAVTELRFREPTFAELRQFGEPYSRAFGKDGVVISRISYDVVNDYARALVQGVEPLLLDQCSARDGVAIGDVIIGFFSAPAAGPAPSNELPNSSLNSDGTPPLSIG